MTYAFKIDIRNMVNFPLYIMFYLKECIFWAKVTHRISTFSTFYCLPEVVEIPRVIFETRSQFL